MSFVHAVIKDFYYFRLPIGLSAAWDVSMYLLVKLVWNANVPDCFPKCINVIKNIPLESLIMIYRDGTSNMLA